MAVTKEDIKTLALTVAYDFVLVALVVCWAIAIALAILESAYWLPILFFVLGTGFFLMAVFLFKDENEEEVTDETIKEETEPESEPVEETSE